MFDSFIAYELLSKTYMDSPCSLEVCGTTFQVLRLYCYTLYIKVYEFVRYPRHKSQTHNKFVLFWTFEDLQKIDIERVDYTLIFNERLNTHFIKFLHKNGFIDVSQCKNKLNRIFLNLLFNSNLSFIKRKKFHDMAVYLSIQEYRIFEVFQ